MEILPPHLIKVLIGPRVSSQGDIRHIREHLERKVNLNAWVSRLLLAHHHIPLSQHIFLNSTRRRFLAR
jgi:hypothetical protein